MRKWTALVSVCVVVVIVLAILVIAFAGEKSSSGHGRIVILSDADFTEANGVSGGNGTPQNPYVIEGWSFDLTPGTDRGGIYVENVISHLIVRNSSMDMDSGYLGELPGNCGIEIAKSSNVSIENCRFSNLTCGILVSGSDSISVRNCSFISCNYGFVGDFDIYPSPNEGIQIVGNRFLGDESALHLWDGRDYRIEQNSIAGCGRGVTLERIVNVSLVGNSFQFIGEICVLAQDSSYVMVVNNVMSRANDTGLRFSRCGWSEIAANSIRSGQYGIRIDESRDILITENGIGDAYDQPGVYDLKHGPSCIGVALGTSVNVLLTGNVISTDYVGVLVLTCTNFTAYRNAFVEGIHAQQSGVVLLAVDNNGSQNTWDDGAGEGNYWYKYRSYYSNLTDVDSDGVYDNPFFIDSDSLDRYPFVEIPQGTVWPIL
jgi:parallel beta-helix repeat protein